MKTGKINRVPQEVGLELTLDDLLWLRAEWLQSTKVVASTRTDYEYKTRHFVNWWQSYGPAVNWRLTQRHLAKFEEYLLSVPGLHGDPMAWHTRHNALRRAAELLGWAHKNGYIEGVNPRGWMPAASGEPPERKAPTSEQLAKLMIAAAEISRYPLRDQTILALFIGTGMRLTELTDLRVENIMICADGSGTAAIVGKRTRANKSGKRTVAFDATTGRYLTTYLDSMLITEGPLFLNDRHNTALCSGAIYKMVKRTITAAGLEDHIQACHDLRRAFATVLSLMHPDSPAWGDMIRRQLGHKHYSQTASYNKMGADDIRTRILSPLADRTPAI